MNNKTIWYAFGTIVLLIGMYLVFTPHANAQFVPCVWPNRC